MTLPPYLPVAPKMLRSLLVIAGTEDVSFHEPWLTVAIATVEQKLRFKYNFHRNIN